jgi:hypothetical protein
LRSAAPDVTAGTFTIYYSHKMTGPGLPGNVQTDNYSGRWRLAPDVIFTVTIKSTVPGIDRTEESVVFVFVR